MPELLLEQSSILAAPRLSVSRLHQDHDQTLDAQNLRAQMAAKFPDYGDTFLAYSTRSTTPRML